MTGVHTMRVKEVRLMVAHRSDKSINLITLMDSSRELYIAEEPVGLLESGSSKFTPGTAVTFRVCFPANQPGKRDWIEYISDGTMPITKEAMAMAVAAFGHVSKYEPGLSDSDLMWRTFEVGTLIKQAASLL